MSVTWDWFIFCSQDKLATCFAVLRLSVGVFRQERRQSLLFQVDISSWLHADWLCEMNVEEWVKVIITILVSSTAAVRLVFQQWILNEEKKSSSWCLQSVREINLCLALRKRTKLLSQQVPYSRKYLSCFHIYFTYLLSVIHP